MGRKFRPDKCLDGILVGGSSESIGNFIGESLQFTWQETYFWNTPHHLYLARLTTMMGLSLERRGQLTWGKWGWKW